MSGTLGWNYVLGADEPAASKTAPSGYHPVPIPGSQTGGGTTTSNGDGASTNGGGGFFAAGGMGRKLLVGGAIIGGVVLLYKAVTGRRGGRGYSSYDESEEG